MNALSLVVFNGLLVLLKFSQGAIIGKCINHREDKVTFNCPRGHVIYRPVFYAGISNSSSCFFQDGDCTGLTTSLITQKNKCYWRESCSLRWRSKLDIVSTKRRECMGKRANYVNYESPTCVPTENIYDICSADTYSIKSALGVIRSHSDYPWTYGGMRGTCRRTLKPRSGHILVLTVDDLELETDDSDKLEIRLAMMNSDHFLLRNAKLSDRKRWFIKEGFVEIIFTVTPGVKSATGFILQFENVPENGFPLPHNSSDFVTYDKASFFFNSQSHNNADSNRLDECISSKEKSTNLYCPSDHVIYKPELQVGVSNFRSCMHQNGDCVGLTHTLLTQRNKCYWKSQCELKWRSGIPITLSSVPSCLALPPSYLSLLGFSCIAKDQVFDICDRNRRTVNLTYGLIRSHKYYPWHYDTKKTFCRMRIRIHRKLGLRISSDDIDLDPDNRNDNVKIFSVGEDGSRKRLKKFTSDKKVEQEFHDGCVDIEFRVSKYSKGGRGFVLKLKPVKPEIDGSDDDFSECPEVNKRKSRRHRRRKIRRRIIMEPGRRKTKRILNKVRLVLRNRRRRKYNSRFNKINIE